MKMAFMKTCLAAAAVLALGTGPASAATLLSDFSNFNLTGTYVDWQTGTFTSGPTDFRVQSDNFGGGFFVLPAPVNASGETALEVRLDVNPGNVSDRFNVVLVDGDGTERVYRFTGLGVGAGQVVTTDLTNFLQDNAVGGVPGLDISNLTVFHLQGTFENTDPIDMTFDNLALVPEPASLALMGLGGLSLLWRKR